MKILGKHSRKYIRKLRMDRIQLPEKYKENVDVSSKGPSTYTV
jgi:hypothetical protein